MAPYMRVDEDINVMLNVKKARKYTKRNDTGNGPAGDGGVCERHCGYRKPGPT